MKKIFFCSFLLIVFLINGCSWFFEPSEEAKNESYEAGNKALSEGKFEEAKSFFRQIPQSSPFYPQAIWMIQKVPFKKGVAAYNQKKYQLALDELSKIPTHSPEYEEAKKYKKLTTYSLLLKKYKDSKRKDSFYMIKDLIDVSNELDNLNFHLKNFSLIENELKVRMSKKKTAYLINLLWSMIELNNEPKLNQKALDYLLKDIEFFYNQPEVRPLVFQIIGNLKIELRRNTL